MKMMTTLRRNINVYFFLTAVLLIVPGILWSGQPHDAGKAMIHHDLKVTLDPGKSFIEVNDTIEFPSATPGKKIHFLLHGGLELSSAPKDVEIKKETGELKHEYFGINTAAFEIKSKIPLNHYSIRFLKGAAAASPVTLSYRGRIHHPVKKTSAEYARGFSQTPGIIDNQGVYLAGSTFWVPWFNDDLFTYTLDTNLPKGWTAVSQGKRTGGSTWDCAEPMEEIYLIAAKFHQYRQDAGKVQILAFLRTPDESLANKYLETTGQYLEMYEKLIGPYPYTKFALIENFWETGYGMPSFTLLGSKVIRFPFILHSSYPHELLHNWWGNGVLVDYTKGNWCEGLTVYLADHLIKEQRGQGQAYRKTTLQGYTHYAAGKKEEFPLTKFKARYNALSSSIGYGKSMMMFHMLRHMVGDKTFNKAISHFYKNNKYKAATFSDIRQSFETVAGEQIKKQGLENLEGFFEQWVTRKGAPELKITKASVKKTIKDNKPAYTLGFTLEQAGTGKPYYLSIPAAIYLKDNNQPVIIKLAMKGTKKHERFQFSFPQPVEALQVDPRFDIFRTLHENEIPPTLSGAFGADNVLILLPSGASALFLEGYRVLAEIWATENKDKIEIKMDNSLKVLPADRAIWLLGKENIHRGIVQSGVSFYRGVMDNKGLEIDKKNLPWNKHSIIAAIKNPGNPLQMVVLLSTDRVAALPGLARKLPHYGKYSFLAFEGDEPANMFKGQWPVIDSPMTVIFTKDPITGTNALKKKLPKTKPLARLAPLFSGPRMFKDIEYLSSEELEGRGLGSKGLEKAAHYIAVGFKKAGLKPGGDNNTYMQSWEANAGPGNRKIPMKNVIGIIPGTNPAMKGEAVVLCAHYDHLGLGFPDVSEGNKGKIHPGADDNASGVAVLLEIARTLGKSLKPERSIIFIGFTGEESGRLGSKFYINSIKARKDIKITAAVNLDTVGRLSGQKLKVIGGSSAREWRFIFMGIQYTVGVESELLPKDLDSSDQTSFHEAGVPAIQLFSGAHPDYHRPGDTADKIDSKGLLKAAAVTREAIIYLSGRKEPLTITLKSKKPGGLPAASKPAGPSGGRRVRTGLMPDFSFAGSGVKIGMVMPSSPAAKAGLQKGDVIIKVNGTPATDLKTYASILKQHKPGDTVTVTFTRDSKEHSVKVKLEAR